MEHLRPNAIDHPECHFGSVLGWIDVHAERALAERRSDDAHDLASDFSRIRTDGPGVVGEIRQTLKQGLRRPPLEIKGLPAAA